MAIGSARWLGLGYFTYFFCYGIYLPFWGVWLKGTGLDAEKIGLLLGCGMVARFVGSLLIASQVKKSFTVDYGAASAGADDLPVRCRFLGG
ncbi:Probable 3-phenylpropionic acid transporter [Pantoea agglomerans]|uniref:Probable 3-phenylpropionic acid transporter n=1 Tax=Enterobacter agglomerans TaxID=549 RepID=A0A379AD79_ENTAG|nr:Probable 3-phenylpropionic acid transporter [Pantoea agglomerans]